MVRCGPPKPYDAGSIPAPGANFSRIGGMVYTGDLNPPAERLTGSSPVSGIFLLL
jgi:hypothetical protein